MPTDGYDEYARKARAAPQMAQSEAVALTALAQSGDDGAQTQLLQSHRRIVARLVKQYEHSGMSAEERIRLGEQGLGIAIEKFDGAKGFSFSAYATWWIRQTITRGFGDEGGASVPEPRAPVPPFGSASTSL